jgi:hypothetical protein
MSYSRSFLSYAALVVGLALLFPAIGFAHAIGLSRGEYRAAPDGLEVELAFARDELVLAFPQFDLDADGTLDADELDAARESLGAAVVAALTVQSAGATCVGSATRVELIEGNGVAVDAGYRCIGADQSLQLRLGLFDRLSFGHRHFAHVAGTPPGQTRLLFETQADWELAADASSQHALAAGGSLFGLGIEHILTGYDHLVFLLGLILVGRRLKPLLILVSAFTAGHMISFGLASLDILFPDPGLIEPAIALTIAYIGVENWLVRDASHRWLLAFPFGLIHGFGFGGAMRELDIASDQLLRSLLAFNLGVEAGQLAVLAVLLPTLWWLRKSDYFLRYGTQTLSTLVALAGAGWFCERVLL